METRFFYFLFFNCVVPYLFLFSLLAYLLLVYVAYKKGTPPNEGSLLRLSMLLDQSEFSINPPTRHGQHHGENLPWGHDITLTKLVFSCKTTKILLYSGGIYSGMSQFGTV